MGAPKPTPEIDPNINWYRNAGAGRNKFGTVYHKPELNWVLTGRAVCGANISHPARVTTVKRGETGSWESGSSDRLRLCKRCRGLVVQAEAVRSIVKRALS